MKFSLQSATAILPLLLATLADAANPAPAAQSCRTELGTKSVKNVPTVTTTITNPAQPTVTSVVRSTVTSYDGLWYTYTYFTTKTKTKIDTAVTDTFSSTTTLFQVETDTVTSTVTTTTTSTSTTSSTSTTIIPTTAGFRNIHDTLNSNNLQRRAAAHPHAVRAPAKVAAKPLGALALTQPTKVDCTKTLPNTKTKTVYTTLKPVTTTVPYWAWRTVQVNTITTTTTIVPPEVSVTLTETSTSSVTTFTTTFETSTVTASTTTTNVLPGPTVWNACNPQNVMGPNFNHNGNPYYAINIDNNGPGVASDFKIVADGASSALECCNACQKFGTCETFIFRQTNRNCFLLYHDGETCDSQYNHPNFILSRSGYDSGAGYAVGNGNCGYTYSGNSDGSVYSVDL